MRTVLARHAPFGRAVDHACVAGGLVPAKDIASLDCAQWACIPAKPRTSHPSSKSTDSPTLRPSGSGSPNRPCTALNCRQLIQLLQSGSCQTQARLRPEYLLNPQPGGFTPQARALFHRTTAADSHQLSNVVMREIWDCLDTEGSRQAITSSTAGHTADRKKRVLSAETRLNVLAITSVRVSPSPTRS